MTTTYTETSVIVDRPYAPKVTLTRDTGGTLTATLEIEGLAPNRDPSIEETAIGVLSLDPPKVYVADHATRKQAINALIASAYRAVFASVESTQGATLSPMALSAIGHRVSIGLRRALRLIEEDA
jgi:hypothetical protein